MLNNVYLSELNLYDVFSFHISDTEYIVVIWQYWLVMMDTNLSLPTVLEEYGKLFYIIHPGRNSFPGLEGVPDYVQQAMPYMVTLIVLEAVVNLWLGKRHNIADRWEHLG